MQASWQNPIFDLISDCADAQQTECYVIGGYVRDWLLNRPSKDIDIVVVGSGIELAKALKAKLGRKASLSIFKNFGTAQIKYKDTEIEFVGARKESYRNDSRKPIVENGSLEDDQKRRDFTINAMAICLNKSKFGELTDPFGGKQDLEYKILRTPLNPDVTFSDDPLRMMRCIRFATQLKFSIEDGTYRALQTNKERISIISKERILDELNKIMMSEKPSIGLDILYKCGLLEIIMPEISNLKGVEIISGKAHKDIFYHTLEVVDNVAKQSSDLWLRWAALFHDVGKPATKRFDPKIGWMFHNHNYVGEKMIPHIFKRMKFPMNEKMRYVQKIVSLHMRPIALVEEEITDSAVRRLLFEGGDDIDDLMTLCEADITSKNEAKVNKYMQNLQIVRLKLKDIEQKDHVRNFQPPIDGAEIMRTFGLEPSGTVGKIKAIIKEAILDGKIPNEYEPAHKLMIQIAASMGLTPIK